MVAEGVHGHYLMSSRAGGEARQRLARITAGTG